MTTFIGMNAGVKMEKGKSVRGAVRGGLGLSPSNVLRVALMDPVVVSTMRLPVVGGRACECRLHVRIDCGKESGVGCEALGKGTAGPIRISQLLEGELPGGPAYVGCEAELGTRYRDAEFVGLVLKMAFGGPRGLINRFPLQLRRKFANGTYKDMSCFGAGYCNLEALQEGIRMRVARVLGPKPFLVAAAATISVMGQQQGFRVKLVRVGDHLWHAERTEIPVMDVAGCFLVDVCAVVRQHGYRERLGSTPEINYDELAAAILRAQGRLGVVQETEQGPVETSASVGVSARVNIAEGPQYLDFLKQIEVLCEYRLPRTAGQDVALARYTAATVPGSVPRGRDRLKALSNVGDAALLLSYVTAAYKRGDTMQSIQQVRTGVLTDMHMARVIAASPLAQYLVLAGDVNVESSTGASAYEAIAGVISLHCPSEAVSKFASKTGLHSFM